MSEYIHKSHNVTVLLYHLVFPAKYRRVVFYEGFRADLIVEGKVILELKSVEKISNVHKKQLLTYLRLSEKKLGLLINFGDVLLKNGITKVVNGL